SGVTTPTAGANSIKPLLVSTPVIRQVPAAVGVVRKETACVSGRTINSLVASLPCESAAAVGAAFISRGTVLNLFSGKKPAWGGRAWTASGASSFNRLRRSAWDSARVALSPRRCAGSAPGLRSGEGGNVARGIAAGTVARLSNNCLRSAFCSSPKIKSFASSTPLWRELSARYRLCRSPTVDGGHDVISPSSKRGDHPPQYNERPPTV